ncbi:MAG: heavy metal-binding domain-containing protein [Catenulispora sp.]
MIVSGFSGNEMYCLAQKGFTPGSIVVGNSVQSLGVVGSITSGLRTVAGGEIENLTKLIVEGRHAAIERLEKEARTQQAAGVTGVSSDLKQLSAFKEFIAIGSTVSGGGADVPFFTTACSGQDLYCQIDAGYQPRHFVMGNVAYALGVGRAAAGFFRGVAGGEVKEISDTYNRVRHLALERLEKEALERGANAVVDVQSQIISLGAGANEMLMVGTASYHPALGRLARPVTSELTGEELWNLTKMGYVPLRLLLGTSVYALGVGGGIGAFFQGLSRGEVDGVTKLIYEARSNCLAHVQKEAGEIGADAVIGVKMFIYEIGSSFVEVMAIGTAIKKMAGMTTQTEVLIPQAVIRDRDTFFDNTHGLSSQKLERQ